MIPEAKAACLSVVSPGPDRLLPTLPFVASFLLSRESGALCLCLDSGTLFWMVSRRRGHLGRILPTAPLTWRGPELSQEPPYQFLGHTLPRGLDKEH